MNLTNRHFFMTIKNQEVDCIIKERRASGHKTPLYIWDMTRMCYISGLKQTGKGAYIFNIRGAEKDGAQNYRLTLTADNDIEIMAEN